MIILNFVTVYLPAADAIDVLVAYEFGQYKTKDAHYPLRCAARLPCEATTSAIYVQNMLSHSTKTSLRPECNKHIATNVVDYP